MASWQAHVLSIMIRMQIKPRARRARDVEGVRRALGGGTIPVSPKARINPGKLGGIAGEWVGYEDITPRGALLYLHGGGYVACSTRTHRALCAGYAARGLRVFSVEYRLAPEHPFPAAVEDAVAAWNGLMATAPVGPVGISGDSAGGGLALATMLKLREIGARLPDAAALFSPWTDLTGSGESVRANAAREAMLDAAGIARGGLIYAGGTDPRDPLVSPLFADLAGLPPLLIHVGEREILLDDSRRLAERARAAGARVDLQVFPVVPHVWQLAHHFVPEGRRSLDAAAAFVLAASADALPAAA